MKLAASFISMVIFAACSSVGGMSDAPEAAGVAREFEQPIAAVLEAAREVVPGVGFQIEKTYRSDAYTWFIVGKRSATREAAPDDGFQIEEVYSSGDDTWIVVGKKNSSIRKREESVRVMVRKRGHSSTTVRVYSEAGTPVGVTANGDYSDEIFDALEVALAG